MGPHEATQHNSYSFPLQILVARGSGVHTPPMDCDENSRYWLYGVTNINATEWSVTLGANTSGDEHLINLLDNTYRACLVIFWEGIAARLTP